MIIDCDRLRGQGESPAATASSQCCSAAPPECRREEAAGHRRPGGGGLIPPLRLAPAAEARCRAVPMTGRKAWTVGAGGHDAPREKRRHPRPTRELFDPSWIHY